MSFGLRIANFIAQVGSFEKSFVVRTDFNNRMAWTCCVCGHGHFGRYVGRNNHRNPYPTYCYKCGIGHVVWIGGSDQDEHRP